MTHKNEYFIESVSMYRVRMHTKLGTYTSPTYTHTNTQLGTHTIYTMPYICMYTVCALCICAYITNVYMHVILYMYCLL